MIETNADDVADELLGEAEQLREDFEAEKQRTLEEARDLAKERVPVRTGKLKRATEIRGDAVVADTDYAQFVNFGSEHNEATLFLTDSALDAFRNSIKRLEQR
jgi:Zn-dependent peptidase ImmA (M78 family)